MLKKRISCLGLLTVLSACAAPQPAPNYPLLSGASSPDAPAPPPIAQDLTGVGNLQLGMSRYDAATLGYNYDTDEGGVFLSADAVIDGIQTTERLNFSGTPDQLSNIVFLVQKQYDSNNNSYCPNPQPIFNDLLKKYGPEKTTQDSSGLISAQGRMDENFYTWTFNGGRTIQLMDFEGPLSCASVHYSEAEAPENAPSL